jgi:hypothetical protein
MMRTIWTLAWIGVFCLALWVVAQSGPPRVRVVCPPKASVGAERVCVCTVRGVQKAATTDFRYIWQIDGHPDPYEEEYGMLIIRWARLGTRTVACNVWHKERHIGRAETTVEVVER